MPEYKLIYFKVRGRGEFIRYILKEAGQNFTEEEVTMENWPEKKPKMPMGQVPVLDADGKMLAQSVAIGRYLANEHGLAGKDNWEKAQADMYVDGVNDVLPGLSPVYQAIMANDVEKKEAAWSKYRDENLKPFLDRYEKFLGENHSGWLVGDHVTWADLVLAEFTERLNTIYEKDVINSHAKVLAHMHKVHELPHIKKYVAERPHYTF